MNRRLALSVIVGSMVLSSAAQAIQLVQQVPSPRLRRLYLVNAHTGERFEGPYRDDNGPLPSAMKDLSDFLRDFHSGTKVDIDIAVIDFLANVMDAVSEERVTVLSAYRSPETNAMLRRTTFGVAENSQHMYGRALDVFFGAKLTSAVQAARAMRRGGVGWYPRSDFMHLDSGPIRNWDLDQSGFGSLLLRADRRPAGRFQTADGRLLISPDTGQLLPETARQHESLTTQQLLKRVGR